MVEMAKRLLKYQGKKSLQDPEWRFFHRTCQIHPGNLMQWPGQDAISSLLPP